MSMAPSCKICGFQYRAEDRVPIALSCGHSFCRQCLNLLQISAQVLRCPTCTKAHSGRPLSDLPDHLRLLEITSNNTAPPSAPDISQENVLVYVRTSLDMQIPLTMRQDSKVYDLKMMLQIHYGLDAVSGFILSQGQQLSDEKSLIEYNINDGAVLELKSEIIEAKDEIVTHLGSGGFGDVFLIKRNGRNMVLKKVDLTRLNEKARSLAIQEMKLLESLNHPNIVAYQSGYKKNECLHMFMEYCGGGDLAGQIETKRETGALFGEIRILSWTYRIAEALEYIHERKIIHRDIKPANIFLSNSGTIKIGDFGISRVLGENTTRGSTMIGTAKYTAIEVLNNEGFTTKADMFSLGCTIYEISTFKTNYPYIRVLLPESFSSVFQDMLKSLLDHNPSIRPEACDLLKLTIFKNIEEHALDAMDSTETNLCNGQQNVFRKNCESEQTMINLRTSIKEASSNNDEPEVSGGQNETLKQLDNNSQESSNSSFEVEEQTLIDLRQTVRERLQTPPPLPAKLKRKKKKAPPVPPRPESRGPTAETCLKILDKFCEDVEAGRTPDQKKGLQDIIAAMTMHQSCRLIQMQGCLALSYITIHTSEGEPLTAVMRNQIMNVLINVLEHYRRDSELRAACCQNLCQFAKPSNLLRRMRQLVPQLLVLIRETDQHGDPWSCLYALHLLHSIASRVGEEFRIILAQLGTMEVLINALGNGRKYKCYEDIQKFSWSILCNLTDENAIICDRFIKIQGLSLISECLSMSKDHIPIEGALLTTLGNISAVKELRHHLINDKILNILINYLEQKSKANEISWLAAMVLVNLMLDGENAWPPNLHRHLVIQKLEEKMVHWDIDSQTRAYFKTLRPIWCLLEASHTPVCQYWATWTLANLTKIHRDRYCPMIIDDGGLSHLQRLLTFFTKTSRKPGPFRRSRQGDANSSFSIMLLAMQVKNSCDDFMAYGNRHRDLVMKLFRASANGKVDSVSELTRRGINLNTLSSMRGHEGRSAIHLATLNGHIEVVCTLLDAGAFIDNVDIDGMTALHTAALSGQLDLLNLLLIYGSDLYRKTAKRCWNAVHFASAGGHIHILEFLSERCDLTDQIIDQRTALHLAAEYGQEAVVKWLLSKGLDTRHRDAYGRLPLFYATEKGHANIVGILTNAR